MKLAILAICALASTSFAIDDNAIRGDAADVKKKGRGLFGFTTSRYLPWWYTTSNSPWWYTTTKSPWWYTTSNSLRSTTTTAYPTTTTGAGTTRTYHFQNGNGKDTCETSTVIHSGKTCRGWVSDTMRNAAISITTSDDTLKNYWNARRWVARNIQGCSFCDTTIGAGTTTTFAPEKVSKCVLCTRQCSSICNLVYSDSNGLGNEQACTYCNAGCLDTCRKASVPVCRGDKHPKNLCDMVKKQGFCKDNDSTLKGRNLQLNGNKIHGNAGSHSNWVLGIVDGCCATCGNGRLATDSPTAN